MKCAVRSFQKRYFVAARGGDGYCRMEVTIFSVDDEPLNRLCQGT
jgi:hypothetical protein